MSTVEVFSGINDLRNDKGIHNFLVVILPNTFGKFSGAVTFSVLTTSVVFGWVFAGRFVIDPGITVFMRLRSGTNPICVAEFVLELLRDNDAMIYEFQLFWLAHILEDRLLNTNSAAEIIDRLNNHPNATPISKAKLLEIPDLRYGLVELRDAHLGAGQSDWLSWSSAVGHRGLNMIDRRHRLGYFAKASNYNKLVFDIVSKD